MDVESEDKLPSLVSILKGLKPGVVWKLLSAILFVLVGAFGLGMFVQKALLASSILTKDTEIFRIENEAIGKQDEIAGLIELLKNSEMKNQLLDSKAEFLNRYVSYVSARDSVSRKLFADYVCIMWRQTQERRLNIDREQFRLSVADLKRGISPEIRRLLAAHNIDDREIAAAVSRSVVTPLVRKPPPGATRFKNDLRRIRITKTVTFFDGSQYDVPEPVAIDVHTRPDCAPR